MCHFKKHLNKTRGFTVIEVATALVILAIIFTTVLTVFKDAMRAVSDDRINMQAFELARENMERILSQSSVSEQTEYGVSEINPQLVWELRTEPFSDPSGSGTWVKAISSATYLDANDQPKTLELTCWLTKVSKEVATQMMKDRELRDANEFGNSTLQDPLLEGYDGLNGDSYNLDGENMRTNNPAGQDAANRAKFDAIMEEYKNMTGGAK
ncbi:MAG: hypothetical protein A2Y07_04735 [Planctomycetes bacterium GWF2_50_10]|nr:MAG: hypothetical protein A2Y07_04735 [Planctomycetes bacterium GWF2_50_10]